MEPKQDYLNVDFSGKKILIVEDDDICFYLLKECLDDTNVQIIHANNGQSALDIFFQYHDIDLVLLDIQIPIVDGYSVMQIMKSENNKIPVIAQTAHGDFQEYTKTSKVYFDDYLPKPIGLEDLFLKLNKYLLVKKLA